MKWRVLIISLLLLGALSLGGIVYAHGAVIEYAIEMTVTIHATFDTGEPMAQGQVTVYAPDDPATPWLTGECDDEGRFSFAPDPAIPGTWDVQVRHSGHGDIVHIPITENMVAAGSTGQDPLQIVVMSAAVVWGFVGTALYFSGRRKTTSATNETNTEGEA